MQESPPKISPPRQEIPPEVSPEESWQQELGRCLRSAEDLSREGLIPEGEIQTFQEVLSRYQFRLPRYYASLIDRADPACPIRKQAIPSAAELQDRATSLLADPLADLAHQPAPRITHRYGNRALLHLTPNCSMYCRYCFRKTLLNELSAELFRGALEPAFRYLAEKSEITEVILSGGDPLLCRDSVLQATLEKLSAIEHLKRVRIHTRVPVTFPIRVTDSLGEALIQSRFSPVIVTHFNHPREVTPESTTACRRLREKGLMLLNQSVLLKGVNDRVEILAALSEALFDQGVLPYYLHHPDRAEGTAHFDLSMARGIEIHREMRQRLPGYLVPRYVVDVVGEPFKVNVAEHVPRDHHFFFQSLALTPSISMD